MKLYRHRISMTIVTEDKKLRLYEANMIQSPGPIEYLAEVSSKELDPFVESISLEKTSALSEKEVHELLPFDATDPVGNPKKAGKQYKPKAAAAEHYPSGHEGMHPSDVEQTPSYEIEKFLKENKIPFKKNSHKNDDITIYLDDYRFIMWVENENEWVYATEGSHESIDLASSKKLEGLLPHLSKSGNKIRTKGSLVHVGDFLKSIGLEK